MRLSYVLVATTATAILANGNALSNSEQSTIARMAPTQDRVRSVDAGELDSGGKRLLRTYKTEDLSGNDAVDAKERAWSLLRYSNLVNSKKSREFQFERWFSKGVSAEKAKKKMMKFALTKASKQDFELVATKYAAYRMNLGF